MMILSDLKFYIINPKRQSFSMMLEVLFPQFHCILSLPFLHQFRVLQQHIVIFFCPSSHFISWQQTMEGMKISWHRVKFVQDGRDSGVILIGQSIEEWCCFCECERLIADVMVISFHWKINYNRLGASSH